jgi:hypothetical protein
LIAQWTQLGHRAMFEKCQQATFAEFSSISICGD